MSAPELNRPVDDFEAPATGDQTIRLSDLKGQNVVLYFYPKDNTPGCTTEGRPRKSDSLMVWSPVAGASKSATGWSSSGFAMASPLFPLCRLTPKITITVLFARSPYDYW